MVLIWTYVISIYYIALNHIGYTSAKDIGRALKNDVNLIILNLSN
jgi:hypothetical protein